MKLLVTGGAGFVGRYLLRHIHETYDWELHVTKLPQESIACDFARIHDLDILDRQAVTDLMRQVQPDYIIHLAAQSSVAVSWKKPDLTVDINVKGCVNLLDGIREAGLSPRILLIGSSEEYGYLRPEDIPVREDTLPRPGNIYAATKVSQNLLGSIYARAYGMDIMMVRAFNHIGPEQLPQFVVADFCRQVAEIELGQKPPVISTGNLSAARDFTDVRDVVRAYGLLLQQGQAGLTYNIGSGRAIKIEEILQMILALSEKEIRHEIDPARLRPVDLPIIEADTTRIREATGWEPRIPISETIKETLDYWRIRLRDKE